jgi:hypothetical protein
MNKLLLIWIWFIFNIFIGLYEIYCYKNRDKLNLNNIPKWNSSIIASWNEYCRVDPRYVYKEYVWYFELLNAFYAFILIFILIFYKKLKLVKYILLLEIISCSLYFITLFFEFLFDKNIRNNILENSTIQNRILYYGISSIWIIVPVYLYLI